MKVNITIVGAGLAFAAASAKAPANSFEQSIGVYSDTTEVERRQVGVAIGFDYLHGGLVERSGYELRAARDQYIGGLPGAEEASEAAADEIYAYRTSLSMSQTVKKLTELRQALSFNSEQKARSLTGSLGISHWVANETLRFSADYMKNSSNNPQTSYLDKDFETVVRPELVASEGAAFGLRHLASPQTIVDYTVGLTAISNRPPASMGSLSVRQFVVAMRGALIASITRMINTGALTTQTTYGEITALEATLGWSQTLWTGATGLLEYRNYRENEVTRAYGDQLQLGSDAVTVGVDQQWQTDGNRTYSTTLKISRYETNINVAANVMEFALGAQF